MHTVVREGESLSPEPLRLLSQPVPHNSSNPPVASAASASPISCIYCGSVELIIRDHVPPKCMFPRPKPLDTVTVPACRQCNTSYQMDDEHFTVAMAAVAYPDDADAIQVWQSMIRPMLRRSERF